MADNKGNINLDKGGKKINLDKNVNQPEDLAQAIKETTNEASELDANGNPIFPTNPPQPEEPASVQQPDLSEEAIKDAVENGPQPPKKKGFAWLWAIIGIAIVLAFLGWVFLKKGDSKDKQPLDETEETTPVVGDSTNIDSATNLPSENDANATSQADENGTNEVTGENGATAQTTDAAASADNASTASSNQNPVSTSTPAATAKTAPAVNEASASTGDVQTEALKVIHGDYGDGHVRKERLGSRYSEIQSRVNELKRSGKF